MPKYLEASPIDNVGPLMPAARYNIQMEQGSTYSETILWSKSDNTPRDLTGYSAEMMIKADYGESLPVTTLSSANGEIVLYGNTGMILLSLSADRTAALPVDLNTTKVPPKTSFVYDLELTAANGYVVKVISGNVVVTGEVTR